MEFNKTQLQLYEKFLTNTWSTFQFVFEAFKDALAMILGHAQACLLLVIFNVMDQLFRLTFLIELTKRISFR